MTRPIAVRCLIVTPTERQAASIQWILNRSLTATATRSAFAASDRHSGGDAIAGTPASLLLMMREGSLQVGAVDRIVFNDCDRLMHAGFVSDIRRLARPLAAGFRSVLLSHDPACTAHERLAAIIHGPANSPPGPANSIESGALLWTVVQVASYDADEVVRGAFLGKTGDRREHGN